MADEGTGKKGSTTNSSSPDCSAEQLQSRANNKGKVATKTSVFYVDVKVFLEGVQVPHNSVTVSYGVNGPPTASISLPAAQFLRYIPNLTKVLVVYRDFCKGKDDKSYAYRVLFDGEVSGCSIQVTPSGANMQIEALHTTGYLYTMQITNQAVSQIIYNQSEELIGDLVFITVQPGGSKVSCKILETIFSKENGSKIKTMNDMVYLVLKAFLHSYKDFEQYNVARWYFNKLADDVPGSHKLLNRIYNVNDKVKEINIDVSQPGLNPYNNTNSKLKGYNSDNVKSLGVNTSGTLGNGAPEGASSRNEPGDGVIAVGHYTYDTKSSSPLCWPFKGGAPYYYITSIPGLREAPTDGASSNHMGIDIACGEGCPVYAAADGKVTRIDHDGENEVYGQGNAVIIYHNDLGFYTLYLHLSSITVELGQQVSKQTTLIGLSGSTGVGTVPHLHFEIDTDPYVTNKSGISELLIKADKAKDQPRTVVPIGNTASYPPGTAPGEE